MTPSPHPKKNPSLSFLDKQWFGAGRINLNTRRDAFLRGAIWEPLHNAAEAASFPAMRQAIRKKMWHLPVLLASYEPRELWLSRVRPLARATTAICYFTIPRTLARSRFPFLIPSFHPLRTDTGRLRFSPSSPREQLGAALSGRGVLPHKLRICRSAKSIFDRRDNAN